MRFRNAVSSLTIAIDGVLNAHLHPSAPRAV
jgi:hypothetical protein